MFRQTKFIQYYYSFIDEVNLNVLFYSQKYMYFKCTRLYAFIYSAYINFIRKCIPYILDVRVIFFISDAVVPPQVCKTFNSIEVGTRIC